jgi:hypothetical protein
MTGFGLVADATGTFSTSRPASLITGNAYAADYTGNTPDTLTTAIGDSLAAYNDAAGRTTTTSNLMGGLFNSATTAFTTGVYTWNTAVELNADITISGSPTDIFIFQIAKTLTAASGVRVTLAGGALAQNIFWQIAGAVSFGTSSHCEGIILGATSVAFMTGSSLNGRILAGTAVTLDAVAVAIAP